MSEKKKEKKGLQWNEFLELTKTSFREFFKGDKLMGEGESFIHGAALAYFTVLALVPIIYLAITFFGMVVGQDRIIEIVGDIIRSNMGLTNISEITSLMYEWNIGKGGTSLLRGIGIVAMIFVSTAMFNSLRKSLNTFFGIRVVHRYSAFVENTLKRFIYFGLVTIFGAVIILIYIAQSLLFSFGNWAFSESSFVQDVIFPILEHLSIIIINFLAFSIVFKYFHDAKVRWKMAMTGAFFTAILMYIGQLIVNYYLANFFFVPNSGIAGTLIAVLVWIFYTSQIIFLGAKYMSVYARMMGTPIQPQNKKDKINQDNSSKSD